MPSEQEESGAVQAFANSGRHRATIPTTGEGNCRAFTRPYRSWV